MTIPNINQIADFTREFTALNPEMTAESHPDQYMLYWSLKMNYVNKANIDDLDNRLRRAFNLINDLNDKTRKLEEDIKELKHSSK